MIIWKRQNYIDTENNSGCKRLKRRDKYKVLGQQNGSVYYHCGYMSLYTYPDP